MGRKPTRPGALARLRSRVRGKKHPKTWYYYDHGIGTDGKRHEQPLGGDYGLAVQQWAELERTRTLPPAAVILFEWVCTQYLDMEVSKKASRTRKDDRDKLTKLLEFFNDPPAPLDAIKPVNVQQYLDWRKAAPVRANREKSLLSAIWNFARQRGYTHLANPCAGIKGYPESGRDTYIEDDQYQAIWNIADPCLRDAMDLAYLLGQRPADVLKLTVNDIHDGALHLHQNKTGTRLRIEISDELAAILERIITRKRTYRTVTPHLIVTEHGHAIRVKALAARWRTARKAAGVNPNLQFRDLRAKAGTDKADTAGDARQAQKQLGHARLTTTERYLRNRRGAKVTPTR